MTGETLEVCSNEREPQEREGKGQAGTTGRKLEVGGRRAHRHLDNDKWIPID